MRASGRTRRAAVALVAALMAVACGGGEAGTDRGSEAAPPSAPAASGAEALFAMDALPGDVDPGLAARGADLFQSKGCVACHTLGGDRLVGPDLAGVMERRRPGWVAAMILEPDSMTRNDPDARALFAEYMTPMSDQGLTAEEARAVMEFLRQDAGGDR